MSQPDNHTGRKVFLDLIKIIAILMVLYNHRYTYTGAPDWTVWKFSHIVLQTLATLCRCGVPLFFLASGVVLLRKEESFAVILKHRLLRIFIVMILCTFIRAAGNYSIPNLVNVFFTGLNWYLWAYFDYLLMLPFLRKIALHTSFELSRSYVILVTLFYTASGFLSWFGYYTGLIDHAPLFNTQFGSLCWAFIFPLTGYWIDKYFNQYKPYILRFFLPGSILTVGASVYLAVTDFITTQGANQELVRVQFIFLPSCLLFCLGRILYDKLPFFRSVRVNRFLTVLSGTTFGIFLIETHANLINVINWKLSQSAIGSIHPYLLGLISLFTQFTICAVGVYLLKKIPYVKKLL